MEEMLAVQKDSRLISSESETDIIWISDDNSINSDNNNDAESIASDNDGAVNEVSLERRFLNMDTELNQQVEFQQETENEIRIEKLYLRNLLMQFREKSEKCVTLMMEHSKRSNEMHEEDAVKMKERKRDLWIKMMKILKLESELKSTNIKIDQTKKRLLDYCQKHQQRQRQQQYDSDSDTESIADSSINHNDFESIADNGLTKSEF